MCEKSASLIVHSLVHFRLMLSVTLLKALGVTYELAVAPGRDWFSSLNGAVRRTARL